MNKLVIHQTSINKPPKASVMLVFITDKQKHEIASS